MVELLLDLAKTYANNATSIFNTFLTVLFSSFAFASGFPLANIGKSKKIGNMTVSISSIAVATVLLSFYIISFFSFNQSMVNAREALNQLINLHEVCGTHNILLRVTNLDMHATILNNLPSLGFIAGSTMGITVFLWLANSKRTNTVTAKDG